jgi:drug/metabolite transporter (DMT)-like permease
MGIKTAKPSAYAKPARPEAGLHNPVMQRLSPSLALMLMLPPLMWAGNAVVGRLMVGLVPPLTLNAMRWSLALLILLPLGWQALNTAQKRTELWARRYWLALLGLLGVGAYNALQYLALTTSTPLNVTLIASSMPVWMLAIGSLFYGQHPTRRELLGAALSLLGVAVVLTRGDLLRLAQVQFVPGDLLMIGAAISWAFYSWMLSRPPEALRSGVPKPAEDWAGFLLVQTLFGLGWALGAAGIEQAVAPVAVQWSPTVLAAWVFVAIGPSLVAYRYWGLGVSKVGPAVASLFSNLTPLFAAVLQTLLLSEGPKAHHGVAFALIVAGIGVTSLRRG